MHIYFSFGWNVKKCLKFSITLSSKFDRNYLISFPYLHVTSNEATSCLLLHPCRVPNKINPLKGIFVC